jgi:hypothetical protein
VSTPPLLIGDLMERGSCSSLSEAIGSHVS